MADIVLDANAVGEVVTYVAPGFLTYAGYRLRYPGPDRPPGEVLIISVVLSLPLVALVGAVLTGDQKATQLGYVSLLLALAFASGYVASIVRGRTKTKTLLAMFGYGLEPEGSIYAQTLKHMTAEATVTVELKDGRRVSGCPRNGPQHKDDGIQELYLVYPSYLDEDDQSHPLDAAGVIVPLGEVSNITLSEEPTGAPAT